MKLTDNMSVSDFRDEMQIRVIKHSLRSKPVREAVSFARRQSDPAFYRIALDKIDAQRQFRHVEFGPSRLEQILDLLNGSPRDVGITLLFVVIVLLSLHYAGSWLVADPKPQSPIDVDRIAERMGFYINERQAASSHEVEQLEQQVSSKINQGITKANIDQALTRKLNSVMDQTRFDELAAAKISEQMYSINLEKIISEKLSKVLDEPTLKQLVADRVDQHVTAAGIKERVLAEFNAALKETQLHQKIASQADARLDEFDKRLVERTRRFQDEMSNTLRAALEKTDIDKLLSQRIARTLDDFDKQLSQRIERTLSEIDKRLAGRLSTTDGQLTGDGTVPNAAGP